MLRSKINDATTGNWKAIIQECRNYVPIIEGAEHLGSGLLVSSDGLIITNAHVVERQRLLFVSLHDGTRAKATPVHGHGISDLAIIKASIHTERFFELSIRSLANGRDAGDEVLAIGHPRGLSFTATTGIISEIQRTLQNGVFVQTDVAINPGNSGGPLFDIVGKLVGINTLIQADSQGLGFAIPADQVFEYWQEFKRMYRAGKIPIPSDEQLSQMEQSLSPRQVLESAAELAEIDLEERQQDDRRDWWIAWTASGSYFYVSIDENIFYLSRFIADLDYTYLQDSQLLLQLLRWQYDRQAGMIRFEIDDENSLSLKYSREFENLDVSEAALSLLRMSEAIDLYVAPLEDYLDEV